MTPEEQAAADAAAGTNDETDDAAELVNLAVDDGRGGKVVPLSALIGSKKEMKALRARVKELEPVAADVTRVKGQLAQAQPIIDAVVGNPKLMAEAVRLAGGGAPSRASTAQPMDDAEAVGHAEDMGWYLSDGVTPDAARGRRVLERQSKAIRQIAEEVVRPYAGVTLGDRAERLIAAAIKETDKDGVPIASEESIREVASRIPTHMLSNKDIIDVVLDNAAGKDRRQGRTPKAQDEPLYLESAGSRRHREPAVTIDKDILARVGLTEDDIKATDKKIASAGGKSVRLG